MQTAQYVDQSALLGHVAAIFIIVASISKTDTVHYADLASSAAAEPSASVRARVNAARQRQRARFASTAIPHNAAMGVRNIRQYCQLDDAGERLLEQAMQRFGLSARAHDRIRKVARTIADLAGADAIGIEHLSEAVQYRTLDRQSG